MKKIIFSFLILISFGANSQINTRLDTVFARYRVFTYEELSNIKGRWSPGDSTQKAFWKKMQATVNAVPDKVNGTNITLDSIPGPIAIHWYASFRSVLEGYASGFTNNIKNQIKNYGPLTTHCQSIDQQLDNNAKNDTKNGKDDW
jgi:hypothetical protein